MRGEDEGPGWVKASDLIVCCRSETLVTPVGISRLAPVAPVLDLPEDDWCVVLNGGWRSIHCAGATLT